MENLQKSKIKYSRSSLKVEVENNHLNISVKEKTFSYPLDKISKRLANATEEEKKHFKVSPSGYGIHWYLIDEDISIPALLNEPEARYGYKE